ncbi:MAG TPA: portal protein, partial [Puia sp.]|nr:portal protein [Puia sp.]
MAATNEYYSVENLERIKRNISTSYLYFEDNYKRFRDFRRFVFCESVTEDQRAMLRRLNRPATEFNILEAYISRLLGEFAKQEPSIVVAPADDAPIPDEVCKLLENNIRHVMYDANKNSFAYEIYKDLLSGGFSVAKVWTDYRSPMSFDQVINWARVFDPTLCGFDPLARDSHKGDGQYSFELFPMLEEDFLQKFPKVKKDSLGYQRDIEGFNWTYEDSQQRKTVLVCEYYEKKKRRTRIVKLANGNTMPLNDYKKLKVKWEEMQILEQIPIIVGKPRWTQLETICHYKLIEGQILEYSETDYTYLPHVFFDGHSIVLSRGESSSQSYQMTRPYVYHARGIQDLKNFAGQTLANYLQNQVQHKFIVMKEAIPQEKDYIAALTNPQRASTLVVNAYSENNPDKPIPTPIREVQNVPAPPEVMQAFQVTDPTTQTILGSYAS